MPLFQNPFSLQIPVKVGYLDALFFINENLCVVGDECVSTLHNHHDYEIRYVARGKCRQIIANEIFTADAGEIMLVRPQEYHFQKPCEGGEENLQYNVRFSVRADDRNPQTDRAYKALLSFLDSSRRFHDESGTLRTLFELLTDEISKKSVGYMDNICSLCSMLLTRLIRFSEDDMKKLYPADELKYHGYERSRIDAFLFNRYQGDIKIGDLAAELNISERQVNNVMHKMFGMSFTEKVNELRLQKAAIQLTHTNDPISKISTDCGYKSQNYFLLRFKEKYGKTPTRYRAEKRPKDALSTSCPVFW